MSPNPKRVLNRHDELAILKAMDARDEADENLRNTIVEVSARSSVRVLADFTGMSTNTISRWKADAKGNHRTRSD
ncbi:hypothetical protein [Microbacterium sp. Leaf320]|uniref:hypothetical protein n=1 Tax=Microbacterium sp. Leaf320 TaxID=1736334 RepID=UPI0012F8AAF9|nr:hypothetical protein [Microbacterium sp. Leaf320]